MKPHSFYIEVLSYKSILQRILDDNDTGLKDKVKFTNSITKEQITLKKAVQILKKYEELKNSNNEAQFISENIIFSQIELNHSGSFNEIIRNINLKSIEQKNVVKSLNQVDQVEAQLKNENIPLITFYDQISTQEINHKICAILNICILYIYLYNSILIKKGKKNESSEILETSEKPILQEKLDTLAPSQEQEDEISKYPELLLIISDLEKQKHELDLVKKEYIKNNEEVKKAIDELNKEIKNAQDLHEYLVIKERSGFFKSASEQYTQNKKIIGTLIVFLIGLVLYYAYTTLGTISLSELVSTSDKPMAIFFYFSFRALLIFTFVFILRFLIKQYVNEAEVSLDFKTKQTIIDALPGLKNQISDENEQDLLVKETFKEISQKTKTFTNQSVKSKSYISPNIPNNKTKEEP